MPVVTNRVAETAGSFNIVTGAGFSDLKARRGALPEDSFGIIATDHFSPTGPQR
jgi:hypothetical protein